MQVVEYALYGVSTLTLVSSFLPLVKSDYWVFRVFEYPRFQKLLLTVVCFALFFYLREWNTIADKIMLVLLATASGFLLYKVIPYKPLRKKEMKRAGQETDEGKVFKIFTANVYQYNHHYDKFVELIQHADADLVFLLETDSAWQKGIGGALDKLYPHSKHAVLDNTYGLMFYSKLPVIKADINYLVEEDVPSLDAVIDLNGHTPIQIWGLHPKPPMPNENLRSTAKDKEIMKIAFKAKDARLPVIVFGDFNDVAWSHVTKLFRRVSGLLDPRRGRGFYSTFHAKKWYMRFPLDYIFASEHFSLVDMKRLPATGSDHFPILTTLYFSYNNPVVQDGPEADKEDFEQAEEILEKPVN